MEILSRKYTSTNRTEIGCGSVLGSVWEGFGTVSGFFWALLATSWQFFGRSTSSFLPTLAKERLQEAFWIDFGSIREGIWKDFGKIWQAFGFSKLKLLRHMAVA